MKKVVALLMTIVITIFITVLLTESDIEDIEQRAYDKGYEKGYDDGYEMAASEYGDIELTFQNSDEYMTIDEAPAGTVWITPNGEKYHEGWCQYVNGRNDLTYFSSAEEAMDYGYSPCSVCY